MLPISPDTKIAALLKAEPRALDAIVSLAPAFEKLRNPVLRKVMASVTTIAMAAKIGGCEVADFYRVLRPLGFIAEGDKPQEAKPTEVPHSFSPENLNQEDIEILDVRPVIASGEDPLQLILSHTQKLPEGHALQIINSFEPVPLLKLLQKKGFETHSEKISEGLYHATFRKKGAVKDVVERPAESTGDWEFLLEKYNGNMVALDVRQLEMPGPMHTILEALETLPSDSALFIHHKKTPVFLLPELAQRGFQYRILERAPGHVEMLIFPE